VICDGWRREDGLWDIEGVLTDEKTYPFDNQWRGTVEAGDFVHRMWLRLTVDDRLTVRAVEAAMGDHPFAVCPEITAAYRKVEGLAIRPGWSRRLRELLGGERGCTHLLTLLDHLAIVAFQTIAPLVKQDPVMEVTGRPRHIGSCHALREDGPVVREHYPQWYRKPG
jgi:hypothetical protein